MLMPKVEYTAMLLGATGNVGGHILHLLVQSPLCKKVVVVTRRNVQGDGTVLRDGVIRRSLCGREWSRFDARWVSPVRMQIRQ